MVLSYTAFESVTPYGSLVEFDNTLRIELLRIYPTNIKHRFTMVCVPQ